MHLTIVDEREQTTNHISFDKTTVAELLQQLNINEETVLITKNNEVLTSDDQLHDQDTIEILSVISGG